MRANCYTLLRKVGAMELIAHHIRATIIRQIMLLNREQVHSDPGDAFGQFRLRNAMTRLDTVDAAIFDFLLQLQAQRQIIESFMI